MKPHCLTGLILAASVTALTAGNFTDIPRIDVHAHCGHPDRMAAYVAISDALRDQHGEHLAAWIDLNFLWRDGATAAEYFAADTNRFQGRFLPCLRDASKDGANYTADDLSHWQARGVVGLKIWNGLSEAIAGPDFDALFTRMEEIGLPGASIHVGQPYPTSWCEDPLLFWRSQKAWERVLDRHPRLLVVNAHMLDHFNSDEQLDYLGWLLTAYPNVHVDLAARFQQFHRMDRDKLRAFMIRFADRILFGTDISRVAPREAAQFAARYHRCFQLLETDQVITGSFFDETTERRGLALPREVLEKIYWRNAVRLYPRAAAVLKKLE